MLYRLVTLVEARDQLSILDSEDDVRLNRLILDASQIIMNYLKTSPALDGWTDSGGSPLLDSQGNPTRVGATVELDSNGDPVLDSNGDPIYVLDSNGDPINAGESIIPGPVRVATLLVIAALDDDREGKSDPISVAVQSVLMRMRDPALA